MKNNFIIFCSLIMTIFSILSCTDDNKTINTTEFTLTATLPEGFEDPSISDMVVKFTNVNTGRVINNTSFANNQIQITLPEGMYHSAWKALSDTRERVKTKKDKSGATKNPSTYQAQPPP